MLGAGFGPAAVRASIASGEVVRIRRYWLATPGSPPALLAAAEATGVLACVSAAAHRGWWLPDRAAADARVHVAVKPHAARPSADVRVHWSLPIVPVGPFELIESVEDTLEHIAQCLPREPALVLWESAASREKLSREYLVRVKWTSPAARDLSGQVTGLSDSGLETLFCSRVRAWGVIVRQQIVIAGHRVDALIGDRLIVQVDGYAHHSSSVDRQRDLIHDAELIARGYTVLRFTYAQIVHDWPSVARAVARAIAARRHIV